MTHAPTPDAILNDDPFALVYDETYPCSPARMWALWTERALMASWFGPEGVTSEITAWDLSEGGAWALSMNGQHHLQGEFQVLDEPHRLVITWQWVDDAHDSTVDVRFHPLDDGARTRMVVIHSRLTSEEEQANHDQGWGSTWQALAERVAREAA